MSEKRHPSALFFYFVAAALGVSFSGALLMLAWNNALESETRNFAFDAISVQNAVAANIQTADAVIDNLASFIATSDPLNADRFARYTGGILKRYDYIRGMAYLEVSASGEIRILHSVGEFADSSLLNLMTKGGGRRIVLQVVAGGSAAIPLVHEVDGSNNNPFYLVQMSSTAGDAEGRIGLAALAIDLPSLVQVLAVDPAMNIAVYTESEGVAGRRLVYSKTPASPRSGAVVKPLAEDTSIRLDRYSIRLLTGKDLLWTEIDKGLVFVALFLGVGVTLLLVALARAKELQARELEARNRVIEEQVRQQTHELAEARDQALEASLVKSDFLASMSHEIRTPLNAIIGMAELLSETKLNREQEKYVGVFKNSGEALLSLVNDILDLSKIEARQLSLEEIDFNLLDILEQAVDIYALKADAKGLELISHFATDVPLFAHGDPGRLRQIILNLIGNAIKFTESGQIVTRVRLKDASRSKLWLHFEVCDSGIGIPASKLDEIFSSFTQVDSSTTRKYGGTGLGLTISKRLVEMMGGQIWVESAEEKGSTFQFDVMLQPGQGEPAVPEVWAPGIRSVLIVDGNAHNEAMLTDLFASQQIKTESVDNGLAGFERVKQADGSGTPYDLLLIDSDLKGTNDAHLLSEIRAAGFSVPAIVMFRPSTLAAGAEQIIDLTHAEYVVKPVKRGQLADALKKVSSVQAPDVAERLDEPVPVVAAARILLVEDNPDNRLLIKAYLKKEPYQITEVENGAEAVEQFKASAFDLVLMDVQMPIMDGYTATRAIRDWEQENQREATPVIALTANAIKEDIEKSRAAGCDEHLIKPIKKQTLLDALHARLTAVA
ncbi:MAG: response regulator [Gammaproteobacteria bacterium]|nr:response regulator [Gammaproteobacteria bacterium]